MDDNCSSYKLSKCLQIALLCVQEIPDDRPTMLDISSMLRNESTTMAVPKKPAFWKQTNEIKQNTSSSTKFVNSIDDATITQVEPR